MRTRTAEFDAVWANRRVRKAVYFITMKRRYWDGAAFVLESSPITINRREIDKISGLSSKFDTPLQNRILPSSVSITLLDKNYRWLPTNTAGKWRKSAVASLGYDAVGSEVTIYYGYILSDGTSETLAQFTGVIQDDPAFDSTSGTVTFQLLEKSAAKLEAARAQSVSTFINDQAVVEVPDGVNDIFSTGKKSLWRVRDGEGGTQAPRVNSVAQAQGVNYELDDLNDAETEAKIRFLAGSIPPAAASIVYDGDQWHRDKSISELVGLLCDAASISSGDRQIEEPIFSAVDQSNTTDSAAQWAAGTLTNADASTLAGYLRRKWEKVDDFSDSDLGDNPLWNISGLTAAVSGGKLAVTSISDGVGTQGGMSAPLSKTTGTWEFKATYNSGNFDFNFVFMNNGTVGYALLWRPNPADPGGGTAQLAKWPSLSAVGSSFALSGTDEKTIRITRDSAGEMKVYVNTALQVTATDTTYTTGGYFTLYFQRLTATLSMSANIDDIYYSHVVDGTNAVETGAMIWESPEIDLLAAPSAWLPLLFSVALNGGTYSVRTKSSTTSGGTYSSYTATDSTLTPQSPLRQFLKVEVTANASGNFLMSPVFDWMRVNWRGSSLFIRSADFTGLTCLQAIQELAKIGGMVFGSKGDGTFFFRNRTVSGAADITLSQKNAISAITRYSTGFQDTRTVGVVRYGKSGTDGYYYAEYGASQSGEASPTNEARFGSKTIELDLNRFIFSNDAQVAVAVARKLYEENYRPKRRMTIRTRIIPHLETMDQASISFHDSPLIEKTIYGDPFQKGFPPMGPNPKTLARSLVMKAVGVTQDVMKSESIIDLEEVLS